MSEKLNEYKRANAPISATNRIWPLYGAGFENLGRDGATIAVEMPQPGPDELLVRHDAVGLCFSDIKVIKQGQAHTRIFKDMQTDPVVLGHEVSMTIVQVGENLRDQYRVGDRYIIQADIYKDGVNYAYGYMIQGGLSEYALIDQRVLNGDDGNYLLPVQPETGYAESALTEPWACVIAAYELAYRTSLKAGGTTWIIGTPAAGKDYQIGAGMDADGHPARVILTDAPERLAAWVKGQAAQLGFEVVERNGLQPEAYGSLSELASAGTEAGIDDIVVLGADADAVEAASPLLAMHGILCIMANAPLGRAVDVDVGRIHYHRWTYVGSTDSDIAAAYSAHPVRSSLKPGGKALFVGAGGPMGRMHVQRAIQLENGPHTVVCTDVSDARLQDMVETFGGQAQAQGVELITLNPMDKDAYTARHDGADRPQPNLPARRARDRPHCLQHRRSTVDALPGREQPAGAQSLCRRRRIAGSGQRGLAGAAERRLSGQGGDLSAHQADAGHRGARSERQAAQRVRQAGERARLDGRGRERVPGTDAQVRRTDGFSDGSRPARRLSTGRAFGVERVFGNPSGLCVT